MATNSGKKVGSNPTGGTILSGVLQEILYLLTYISGEKDTTQVQILLMLLLIPKLRRLVIY